MAGLVENSSLMMGQAAVIHEALGISPNSGKMTPPEAGFTVALLQGGYISTGKSRKGK